MVIALLTDFGDFYPGVMKGVIRKISDAEIVDITHSVSPQNVPEGAFLLYHSYRYFPEGTIFVAVVDPGVGGKRRAIAVRTSSYWFVGPDNGLIYPAAEEDRIQEVFSIKKSVSEISGSLSTTFHGRDLFAPAAALIQEGRIDERYFDRSEDSIVKLELFDLEIQENEIKCLVLHIDRFGNVVTNIRKDELERLNPREFFFGDVRMPLVERYEDAEIGEPLSIVGSFDTLELSVREGNFSEKYNVQHGRLKLGWS